MCQFDLTLAQHLRALEDLGLIRLAAAGLELEYTFRHALVQEAVYASLVRADCEAGLAAGDFERTIRRTDETLGVLRERGLLACVPYLLHYRGLALWRRRPASIELARRALQAAVDAAGAIESRHAWWRALAALAQLKSETGRLGEALERRGQARAIVGYLLARTESPGLRQSFLAMPEVRALMGE